MGLRARQYIAVPIQRLRVEKPETDFTMMAHAFHVRPTICISIVFDIVYMHSYGLFCAFLFSLSLDRTFSLSLSLAGFVSGTIIIIYYHNFGIHCAPPVLLGNECLSRSHSFSRFLFSFTRGRKAPHPMWLVKASNERENDDLECEGIELFENRRALVNINL